MNILAVVVLAAVIALALTPTPQPPEERHHIYWCYLTVHENWQGYRLTHTMSLPCMYRTNLPVDA